MSEKISISSEDLQKTKEIAERWDLEIRRWDGLTHALLRSLFPATGGDASTASMRDAYLKLSIDSRKDLLNLAAELSAEGQRYYIPNKWLKKYQAWDLKIDAQSIIKESITTESVPAPKKGVKKFEILNNKDVVRPKLDVKYNSPETTPDQKNIQVLQERIKSNGYLETLQNIKKNPITLPNGQSLSKWEYVYSGSDIDNIDYALIPDKSKPSHVRLFDKPLWEYRIIYYLEKNPSGGEMPLKWSLIAKKDGSIIQKSWDDFQTVYDPKPLFQ